MTDLDRFETALLDRLRDVVAERAAAPAPAPARRPLSFRPRRPRTTLLLAAAAAGLGAVVVPGLVAEPAYSVQEGNDGQVVVSVNEFEDGAGLEALLREHGIASDVTFLPPGFICAPDRYPPTTRRGLLLGISAEHFTVTLEPGTVRDGEILVVAASIVPRPDGVSSAVQADVTPGPVAPCRPVPVTYPAP